MNALLPGPLADALARSDGAQWVRCALQVNPFAYSASNGLSAPAPDQETYDREMIAALQEHDVRLVGLTDHWRARSSESLRTAATAAGITVLPGFEATSHEGAHLLVLFEPDTACEEVERRIGECGHDFISGGSNPGRLTFVELLEQARGWGATVLAPHIGAEVNGLLGKLSGKTRVQAWTHPDLHAVDLSGTELDTGQRDIVEDRLPQYHRSHVLAVLDAGDVNGAVAVGRTASTSWVKLSSRTAAGLDLAFRSPQTRVRREDPRDTAHPRLLALAWEGGFLDGVRLHLNEGLNVLIGGRGSGKSTVLESVRFVLGLEPVTERGRKQHREVVDKVLGSATKVSALVACGEPALCRYRIERTVGSPSNVYDGTSGALLQSTPHDVLPSVDIYGQRELAEIADDKGHQARLLASLLPSSARPVDDGLRAALEDNRRDLLRVAEELDRIEERLARLPVIREQLQRMTDSGVPDRLRHQRVLQQEDRVLEVARERGDEAQQALVPLREARLLDRTFLSQPALDGLPHADLLSEVDAALLALTQALGRALEQADAGLRAYRAALADVQERFARSTERQRSEVDARLRELKAQGIDGAAYLQLERALAGAEPLEAERARWVQARDELRRRRHELVVAIEERTAQDVRRLAGVGKQLSGQLHDVLRVQVRQQMDGGALQALVREHVPGRLDKVERALTGVTSGRALADTGRSGADALLSILGDVPRAQLDKLVAAGEALWLRAEEQVAEPRPVIELNIGDAEQPVWQQLESLSSGQKATALLLLLLSRSDAPLLVDQPEDDLDNAFVSTSIVPRLRAQKDQRQFLLCTHNANIPVLADADLIAALDVQHEADGMRARLPERRTGSLDAPQVQVLVEELLEGGREAFEARRYRYGF